MSVMTHRSTHSTGFGLGYRAVFAILFTAALPALTLARLIGRGGEGGLIEQARQAAHATAGYAVRY